MKLESVEDAKEIWLQFSRKYQDIKPDLTKERAELLASKTVSPEFGAHLREKSDDANESAVKKIQGMWLTLRGRDTLIKVNPKGNHRGMFHHLLNYDEKRNSGVRKSLNKVKLEQLYDAIVRGDWDDTIFSDSTLPQLALSLFSSDKISQQQVYTILDRHQITKEYPLILSDRPTKGYFTILDAEGKFTTEARDHLLPKLRARRRLKVMDKETLETFRLLVAALPKSEQIFYITEVGKTSAEGASLRLSERLTSLDSIFKSDETFIHLSSGAWDAVGLATFGLEQYARPMPRLGPQTIRDIEEGVRRGARYAAMLFPDTKPFEKIHGHPDPTGLEATRHDYYHSSVMSVVPKKFTQALHRFVDIVRRDTGIAWSKELWDWTDNDYRLFFDKPRDVPELGEPDKSTALFCAMLRYGHRSEGRKISKGGALLMHGNITPLGVLVFLDMLKNPEVWRALGIEPEELTDEFAEAYRSVKKVYTRAPTLDTKLQLLLIQSYLIPERPDLSAKLEEFVKKRPERLVGSLSFDKRIEKGRDKAFHNTIQFRLSECSVGLEAIAEELCVYYQSLGPRCDEGSLPTKKGYFRQGIIDVVLKPDQAHIYSNLRVEGRSEQEACFLLNPTVSTWYQQTSWFFFWPLVMSVIGIVPLCLCCWMQMAEAKQTQGQLCQKYLSETAPTTSPEAPSDDLSL